MAESVGGHVDKETMILTQIETAKVSYEFHVDAVSMHSPGKRRKP